MQFDEAATYFAEQFKNPLTVVAFEDPRPLKDFEATILHERSAGTMSAREQFMYTLFLLANSGRDSVEMDKAWAAIAISAIHGDGKGKVSYKFQKERSDYEKSQLINAFERFYKVKPVAEAFQEVQIFVSELVRDSPDLPLAIWAQEQLSGRSRGIGTAKGVQVQKSAIYTTEPSLYGLPLGRTTDNEIVSYTGNRGLVTIAPPESGKSLSQALPALNAFAGHAFVLDLKGHFFERTSAKRRQLFDSRIINFNPRLENCAQYNPLQFISDNPDECWGEAAVLGQLIVPVTNSRDPSWETMAQRVLSLYLAYTVMTQAPEDRKMNKVLDLVAGIGTDEALEAMADPNGVFPSALQRAAHTVRAVRDPKSHAQYAGILQALEQNLHVWNDPRVERATQRSDWSPLDFRGQQAVSVYLTIPLESIASYAPLIRVITAQHVFQLMRNIPAANAPPILFLLDEFPQMGRMDPVRKAIEVGREYGIRTWLFAQFAHQFVDTYGEAGKGIIDICGVRMFMNPSIKDAEGISKEFGNRAGPLQEGKVEVLPVEAIIGPEHRESVFVLSTSEIPLVLKKNFAAA